MPGRLNERGKLARKDRIGVDRIRTGSWSDCDPNYAQNKKLLLMRTKEAFLCTTLATSEYAGAIPNMARTMGVRKDPSFVVEIFKRGREVCEEKGVGSGNPLDLSSFYFGFGDEADELRVATSVAIRGESVLHGRLLTAESGMYQRQNCQGPHRFPFIRRLALPSDSSSRDNPRQLSTTDHS